MLIIVSVYGITFIQQILIALHDGVHIFRRFHLQTDIADGLLQSQKILAQIVVDGNGLISVPDGKLADVADPACTFPLQFAVKDKLVGFPDQIGQGGFSGSVAADQGAVAVFLQGKGNVLKQQGAVESKS